MDASSRISPFWRRVTVFKSPAAAFNELVYEERRKSADWLAFIRYMDNKPADVAV